MPAEMPTHAAIRPRELPKLRTQTARFLADPDVPAFRREPELRKPLDIAAGHLRAAELFFVTQDMTALAVHSGAQLETARWSAADRPAGCGLILWDGGAGMITPDDPPVSIPVEACTWGPGEGGLLVWAWISRRRMTGLFRDASLTDRLAVERLPPLVPIAGAVCPVTAEPVPIAGKSVPYGGTGDGIAAAPALRAVAAAWLLMQQPKIADRRPVRAEAADRRIAAKYGYADPEVTLIDLRRLKVPQDPDDEADTPGRIYRHRWIVSGHWRNAWRPSVGEHRQTWIEAYVKGPDGAPILATERVNVWRRLAGEGGPRILQGPAAYGERCRIFTSEAGSFHVRD